MLESVWNLHPETRCAAALLMLSAGVASADYQVPIAAPQPSVVVGLTNERDPDDAIFTITNSSSPGGSSLPLAGSPHYEIATYDTGASVHLFSQDAFTNYGIATAGLAGAFPTGIGGVGGSVDAIASDPLGVYAAGLGSVTGTSPAITVNTTDLRGQYNASVLYAQPGDTLPNLIGTPIASQYTTRISYGQPQLLDNGDVVRSPDVEILALGSLPQPARRIDLTVAASQLGVTPGFFPSFTDLDDFGNNPATPTVGGSFFLDANVTENGNTQANLEMIFDTGSQGTFVSEQVAAQLGFFVSVDEPDFVVRLAGVTGIAEEVPGFIADEFTLVTTAGNLTLTDVPLVVFDLTDPRDGINTLPGLIGMNLFADRDLILNPEPGNSYLGISDPSTTTQTWTSAAATGTWSVNGNWSGSAPQFNNVADVFNVSGAPQRAVISADTSVSSLNVGGATAGMTLAVDPGQTLTVFGTVIAEPGGTLEVNGDATALGVEVRGGALAGTGNITAEVLSQGRVAPGTSIGQLNITGNFDQLTQGTLEIEFDHGGNDVLAVSGTTAIDGELELIVINGHTPVVGDEFDILTAGTVQGQFDTVDGAFFTNQIGLAVLYSETAVTVRVARPGDLNFDGVIDGNDFGIFAGNFNTVSGAIWTQGDLNGDGAIDGNDFGIFAGNFDFGAASSSELAAFEAFAATVPEPGSLGVLAILALYATRRRRV